MVNLLFHKINTKNEGEDMAQCYLYLLKILAFDLGKLISSPSLEHPAAINLAKCLALKVIHAIYSTLDHD